MVHDLFLFAWLVASGWLAWIGLVSTVLWVVAQIADRPDWGFLKPKRLWSTLAIFFIVAAMFQVWRDQYHEAQRLQSSAAQHRASRRLIPAQKQALAHLLPNKRHFTLRWNPNSETQDYALDLADVFFGILRWTGTSGANSRNDTIPNGLWIIGSSENDLIKQLKTAFKELGIAYHFVEKRVIEDPSMEVELRVGDPE